MLHTNAWLRIDTRGGCSVIQGDKYKLAHKYGLQSRDLRLLDPSLASSYPSAILYRDHAIVVNLEFARVIITIDFVIVVNQEGPDVAYLVDELKTHLSQPIHVRGKGTAYEGLTRGSAAKSSQGRRVDLPFELKALEVCLDTIAVHLEHLTTDLETAAYPALDSLHSRLSEGNLEGVRKIKTRLVRLMTKVETVKEVFEKFLKDDTDMHKLQLTVRTLGREAVLTRDSRRRRSLDKDDDDSSSSSGSEDEAEVAQVEMLLEAYFNPIHNTFLRLQTLNEFIIDMEELVNMDLDQRRNQLITVGTLLTAATAAISILSTVGGVFGQNLDNQLTLPGIAGTFDTVCATASSISIGLLLIFIAWFSVSFSGSGGGPLGVGWTACRGVLTTAGDLLLHVTARSLRRREPPPELKFPAGRAQAAKPSHKLRP
ncbi:MAG: hypothetical protein WDW36_007931 [Sanguina aurantia]